MLRKAKTVCDVINNVIKKYYSFKSIFDNIFWNINQLNAEIVRVRELSVFDHSRNGDKFQDQYTLYLIATYIMFYIQYLLRKKKVLYET